MGAPRPRNTDVDGVALSETRKAVCGAAVGLLPGALRTS